MEVQRFSAVSLQQTSGNPTKECRRSATGSEEAAKRNEVVPTYSFHTSNKYVAKQDTEIGLRRLIDHDKTLAYSPATAMQNRIGLEPIRTQSKPGRVENSEKDVVAATHQQPIRAAHHSKRTLFSWDRYKSYSPGLVNAEAISKVQPTTTSKENEQVSVQTHFIYTDGLIVGGKRSDDHNHEEAPMSPRTPDQKPFRLSASRGQEGDREAANHLADTFQKKTVEHLDERGIKVNDNLTTQPTLISPGIREQWPSKPRESRRIGDIRAASSRIKEQNQEN